MIRSRDYRPEVDGLRAIAILGVVAFHALSWIAPSGFAGVDIFFVISGYLIIAHIRQARERGTFSFGNFWAKRALRILPVYTIVIAAVAAVAGFVYVFEGEFAELKTEILWSTGMAANVLFLLQQGYFDADAATKPLLHFWSLGVEEQFYLAAPVLISLAAAAGLTGRAKKTLLFWSAIFLLSIIGCVIFTETSDDKNVSFYMMPFRAWEFIGGGSTFLLTDFLSGRGPHLASATGIVGIALMLGSLFFLGDPLSWPSIWAAIPVLGVYLTFSSIDANRGTPAERILSIRPLPFIGLVSYSWYLWHWPAIVFIKTINFGNLSATSAMVALAASFALAVLTYYAVEVPIKKHRDKLISIGNWTSAVVTTIVAAIIGVTSSHVLTPPPLAFKTFKVTAKGYDPGDCGLEDKDFSLSDCRKEAAQKEIGLLFGDSHARAAHARLSTYVDENNAHLATLIAPGCLPIFHVHQFQRGKPWKCDVQTDAIQSVKDISPKFVIMMGRWPVATKGGAAQYRPLGGETSSKPARNQPQYFIKQLRQTLVILHKAGAERILIVKPEPEFSRYARECIARSDHYRISRDTYCSGPRDKVDSARSEAIHNIDRAVKGLKFVRTVDPISDFCDESTCRPYGDDKVFFVDGQHMSQEGVEALLAKHADALNWAVGGDEMARD